jgi:hypothetical protein
MRMRIEERASDTGSIDFCKGRLSKIVKNFLRDIAGAEQLSVRRSFQLAVGFWAAWRDFVGAYSEEEVYFYNSKVPRKIKVDRKSVSSSDLYQVIRSVMCDFSIEQLVAMKFQLERFEFQIPWKEGERHETVFSLVYLTEVNRRSLLLERVPALYRNWFSSGPISIKTLLLLTKIKNKNEQPTLDEMLDLCEVLNKKVDDLGFDKQKMTDSEGCRSDFEAAVTIARGSFAEGWNYLKDVIAGCPSEVKENTGLQYKLRTLEQKAALFFESVT